MKRSNAFGVAVVSLLLVGCDAGAPPRLGSLPPGEPAEVEPGYVTSPTLSKWRPPRVVPVCRRSEPTSTSPAIEILSSGGMGGGGLGNVQIWEDGTVLFDGGACPIEKARRGKLSPARVRAVIDTLAAADFFSWSCSEAAGACSDSFTVSLTVRRGRSAHTVIDKGCTDKPSLAAQAIELVIQAVGNNACMP